MFYIRVKYPTNVHVKKMSFIYSKRGICTYGECNKDQYLYVHTPHNETRIIKITWD